MLSPAAARRVNVRRKPWSVPRLRGRGEQGAIVSGGIPFVYALYRAD
jgi:hypothetical protein